MEYILNSIIALTCLSNLAIALYGFRQRKNSKSLPVFIVLCILLAIWNLINLIAFTATDLNIITLATQFSILPTSFIPSTFLYFTLLFRNKTPKPSWTLLFLPSILIWPFILTKYNIVGFEGTPRGSNFIPGPLYTFYGIYFLIFVGLGIYHLVKLRLVALVAGKKRQVDYILFGAAFSALFGITMTVVLPAFRINDFSILGTASSCIFTISTIYAITHYRLFAIQFIAKRLVRQALTFIVVFIIYGTAWFIAEKLIGKIGVGITLVVVMLSLHRLKPICDKWVGQVLSWFEPAPKKLDMKKVENSDIYSIMVELIKLYVHGTTPEMVRFYIFQPKPKNWLQIFPAKSPAIYINDKVISQFIQTKNEIIIAEELAWKLEEHYSEPHLSEMHAFLTKNDIAAFLPIIDNGLFIGFILLGEKTNKSSYSAEDTIPLDKFRVQLLPAIKYFLLVNSMR